IGFPMRIQSVLKPRVLALLFQAHAALATAGGLASSEQALRPNQKGFPIEYREGLIWVQVHIPQQSDPLNFLLDTGAGVSVLNLDTANSLGLRAGNAVSVKGVGASSIGLWPQPLSAKAGDVDLSRNYLTLDLSELSKSCTCPV